MIPFQGAGGRCGDGGLDGPPDASSHGGAGGIGALVNVQRDMEVVGEAANGLDAVTGVQNTEPDVVLMDLTMPGGGGLGAIVALKQAGSNARIVVLTIHDELGYVRAAGQAGAVGYVVKSAVDTELLAAIRAVAQGGTFMDASLALGFAQSSVRSTPTNAGGLLGTAQLTGRELEVLRRVAEGFTNGQIADGLRLDVKSVEASRSRVIGKVRPGFPVRSGAVRPRLRSSRARRARRLTATHRPFLAFEPTGCHPPGGTRANPVWI